MGTTTKAVPSAPTDGGTVDPPRPTVRPVAVYSRPMTDAEALDAVAADIVQRWNLSPLGPNASAKVKAEAEAAWSALCEGFTADMAVLAGDVATVPRPGTVAMMSPPSTWVISEQVAKRDARKKLTVNRSNLMRKWLQI